MKSKEYLLTSILTVAVLVGGVLGIAAQSKTDKMKGKPMEMSTMMTSPHHMLMKAHMKSMSEFTRTLRNQAIKPGALDGDFARAAVAELRHCLDAMDAIHQKQVATMSDEVKANMKMMMEKMEKSQAMLNEHVAALETAVKADRPDSKRVATHGSALLKQLEMMSMVGGGGSPGKKKMVMKTKMPMKQM